MSNREMLRRLALARHHIQMVVEGGTPLTELSRALEQIGHGESEIHEWMRDLDAEAAPSQEGEGR